VSHGAKLSKKSGMMSEAGVLIRPGRFALRYFAKAGVALIATFSSGGYGRVNGIRSVTKVSRFHLPFPQHTACQLGARKPAPETPLLHQQMFIGPGLTAQALISPLR
jgi:hypothetical protein